MNGLPDSRIAREIMQYVRDTASDMLFHHSARVYWWGALQGKRLGLAFDPELLYAAAMFHDIGITPHYHGSRLRFEVDGANAARDFLLGHMNILGAVIFNEIPGAFSDACNKAITFGKPRLMRDDWLKVFDREEIAESIRRIT